MLLSGYYTPQPKNQYNINKVIIKNFNNRGIRFLYLFESPLFILKLKSNFIRLLINDFAKNFNYSHISIFPFLQQQIEHQESVSSPTILNNIKNSVKKDKYHFYISSNLNVQLLSKRFSSISLSITFRTICSKIMR